MELPQAVAPFDKDQAREFQRLTAEFLGFPADETLDLGKGATMTMKLIPAGEFDMGDVGDEEEEPVHRVKLTRPFYLGIYPVTQAQYQAVMGEDPSDFKGSDRPVEMVSWNDARKFCKKLSQQLAQAFSLPTEAQWEYACRAGTTTDYCFGDDEGDLSDYAWYEDNSDDGTHPVGRKSETSFGLYDMHGTVWEWCHDRYGSYSSGPQTDPVGPGTGSDRVRRGGGWYGYASDCRVAIRGSIPPTYAGDDLGFRVVLSSPVRR